VLRLDSSHVPTHSGSPNRVFYSVFQNTSSGQYMSQVGCAFLIKCMIPNYIAQHNPSHRGHFYPHKDQQTSGKIGIRWVSVIGKKSVRQNPRQKETTSHRPFLPALIGRYGFGYRQGQADGQDELPSRGIDRLMNLAHAFTNCEPLFVAFLVPDNFSDSVPRRLLL
jgi:hypothetical protein